MISRRITKTQYTMEVRIEVSEPVEGSEVQFTVTWTNDLELVAEYKDDIDPDSPRHAIVLFRTADGDPERRSSRTIGTGIRQGPEGDPAHSFTALAIIGEAVVAKDRKRVRNARSSMP